MLPKMKAPFLLIFYIFLFTSLFVVFYSFVSPQNTVETSRGVSDDSVSVAKAGIGGGKMSLLKERDHESSFTKSFPQRKILPPRPIKQGCPRIPTPLMKYVLANHSDPLTPREKVLAMCKQTEVVSMDSFFTETMRSTLTKIGEGAFADVFGCQKEGWDKLAVKVIPIEGDFKYNDEPQNSFQSIQTEIVVSIELSLLGDESRRNDKSVLHYTKNFMQIDRVAVCTGKFPDFLTEAWDDYDFRKKSDNDRPADVFSPNQLYIMFSAENSGSQLGSYVYHSFEEAISILQQVSATVAVGESALQFEHRDMHRGNVLVRRTHEPYIYFRIDGVDYSIKSYGVVATIVDYTLSRIRQEDTECTSYINLDKMPWLFKGKGDIQFDVYRDVRNHTKSNWEKHSPYTNVLWINYLATKTSIKAKLKGLGYKAWKAALQPYVSRIKNNPSGKDVFLNVFSPEAVRKINVTSPVFKRSLHHRS